MPGDQLVRDPSGHIVHGEPAGLGCDLGMEEDLEQQVAELLDQVCVAARLDRLDHLEGLLDEVTDERGVGLGRVPGTAGAKPVHHLGQAVQLGRPGLVHYGVVVDVDTDNEPVPVGAIDVGSHVP